MTHLSKDSWSKVTSLGLAISLHASLVWAVFPDLNDSRVGDRVQNKSVLVAALIEETVQRPVTAPVPPKPKTIAKQKASAATPVLQPHNEPSAISEASDVQPAPPATPSAPSTGETKAAVADNQPAVISCATPTYPSGSRALGETGIVLLRLLIDLDGKVVDREIERSSGFARLDEAALSSLSKCKFQPGSVDGRQKPTWAKLRYVWKLN